MTAPPTALPACVSQYAARLHAAIRPGHQVASPLGAWLLLALAGPASRGSERDALAAVLGCDCEQAAAWAGGLLSQPHPAVAGAAAAWTAPAAAGEEHLAHWLTGLPAAVSQGPVPDQAGLDAWAREHTLGLISRFPLDRTDDILLLLASALATRVSWRTPFTSVPAAELGPASPWATRLRQVLKTPRGPGHVPFIAVTPDAGDVAVHIALAAEGLAVASVAAVPDVPPLTVLAAAHRIACQQAAGERPERRSPDDLPVGEHPLWLVREEMSAGPSCTAVLPAWSAVRKHDLSAPGLGFGLAREALLQAGGPWLASQAAMARYSRTGFEAAAVTGFAVATAARLPVRHHVAELRFGQPYAVVAVATDPPDSPWHALPVFSAWVSEPDDAGQEPAGGRPDQARMSAAAGSAYSATGWTGFGTAAATAAAALAGLLFIAVSINLREILAIKSLPSRAAQTLILFATPLLTALLVIVPGQGRTALAIELLLAGLIIGGWHIYLDLTTERGDEDTIWRRMLGRVFPAVTCTGCLAVAGVSMLVQAGGGLYWLVPSVLSAITFGLINVWVLLVEILR